MDYSDPPKKIINDLLNKINQSRYNEVLSEISTIKNDFPNSYALSSLWYCLLKFKKIQTSCYKFSKCCFNFSKFSRCS